MKYAIAALLFLIVMAPILAFADPTSGFTGVDLYADCTEGKGTPREAICVAYIRGVTDGLFFSASLNDHSTRVCMPDNMPSEPQTRLIIEKFMRDHPEKLNENAAIISGVALIKAFPCKSDKAPN